ncbi:MAG TPA: cobyrinic acid a,c-diamide synthase, partial [Actinobacteria bacterium]|nr:cobyrinic acid a,c-diamide synthase [Actinomycetota bacterium]
MAAGRPLVIAGTASGVGKTTLTLGLMGAFRRRGLRVAPFKVGPDYIDPGYHEAVAGTPSRNLDTWLTSPGTVVDIYRRGAAGSDLSVVEGVMGLFDGRAGGNDADGDGSTAEVARLIDGVVVLVVDCARMARSLAPLLAGFAGFDSRLRLGGVVLNNVGSANH